LHISPHWPLRSLRFSRLVTANLMSKHSDTSSPGPNAKRPTRSRKPAGFRLARPPTPPQSTSSASSSSLFVTVTQNENRPGILTRSRVITSDIETVEPITTQSGISATNSQINSDPYNEMAVDSDLNPGEPMTIDSDLNPDGSEATSNPKRKRQTTNYVRPF
jgi:hypothetical protein